MGPRRLVRAGLVLAGLVLVVTAFVSNGAGSAHTNPSPATTTPPTTTDDGGTGSVATGCAAAVQTAAAALRVDPVPFAMYVADAAGGSRTVADVIMDTLQARWTRLAHQLDDEIRFATQRGLDVGLDAVIDASHLDLSACGATT